MILFNEFIDKLLSLLANTIPRLRNAQECLLIQNILQNDCVCNLINNLIIIIPEYKNNWNRLQNKENYIDIDFANNFTPINNFYEFQTFYDYVLTHNIFNHEEADWLDDAIHEILVE